MSRTADRDEQNENEKSGKLIHAKHEKKKIHNQDFYWNKK